MTGSIQADRVLVLSPRPARIQASFTVNLAKLRQLGSPQALAFREALLKELGRPRVAFSLPWRHARDRAGMSPSRLQAARPSPGVERSAGTLLAPGSAPAGDCLSCACKKGSKEHAPASLRRANSQQPTAKQPAAGKRRTGWRRGLIGIWLLGCWLLGCSGSPMPSRAAQGTPPQAGRRHRGRLSLAYFSLAKQREVGRPPGRHPGGLSRAPSTVACCSGALHQLGKKAIHADRRLSLRREAQECQQHQAAALAALPALWRQERRAILRANEWNRGHATPTARSNSPNSSSTYAASRPRFGIWSVAISPKDSSPA